MGRGGICLYRAGERGAGGRQGKIFQAAAIALNLPGATPDERGRAGLVTLAQMRLDLADYRSSKSYSFRAVLDAFNDWQMRKR
jgi:hypothetical protein